MFHHTLLQITNNQDIPYPKTKCVASFVLLGNERRGNYQSGMPLPPLTALVV